MIAPIATLAASVLSIAAVFLAGPWLKRCAGARLVYACWLLPWLGVSASLLPETAASAVAPRGALGGLLHTQVVRLARDLVETSAAPFVVIAWAAIALVFLATQLLAYRAFLRSSARHAVECGRAGAVRIFIGPNVPTPVAVGILRPRILLPADFTSAFSLDEQRMILRHERAHHDRHDIAANLAGLVMLSLHWWNPLAYRAHRRFRADQELACDATATAGLGRPDRHAYATAILKCAARPFRGLAPAMSGRAEAAARLSAIASDPPSGRLPTPPACLAVALLGSLVLIEGAATRAVSSFPVLVAAAPSPAPGFAPTDSPDADICEHGWRSTPYSSEPADYHRSGRPAMRLIVARLEIRRTDRGPPRAV